VTDKNNMRGGVRNNVNGTRREGKDWRKGTEGEIQREIELPVG